MRTKVYQYVAPAMNVAVAARSSNASTNGADVDVRLFLVATLLVIAGGITDGTHTYKIQEADDNGSGAPATYADVAAGQLELPGGITTNAIPAVANSVRKVGYVGAKAWIRSVLTVSGATSGGTTGSMFILDEGRNEPQTNP